MGRSYVKGKMGREEILEEGRDGKGVESVNYG